MKDCKYYISLDGSFETLEGDVALADYIKKNINTSKKAGIKQSNYGNTFQSTTINALEKVSEYDENDNTPYKFLATPHIVDGKSTTLVLKFNDAKYIADLKASIKKELGDPTEDVINNKIKLIIETNVLIQDITLSLNKVFQDKIQYPKNDSSKILKEVILKVLEFNEKITKVKAGVKEEVIEDYSRKILNAMDSKIKELEDLGGVLQPRQGLSVRNSMINDAFTMSAQAHIINIDPQGIAHLFELRTSEIPFEQWDKEKKKHTNYILGIKRQLLSNYVDTSNSTLNIINIVIPKETNGTLSIGNIYMEVNIERSWPSESNPKNFPDSFSTDPLNYKIGPMTLLLRKLLPANLPESNGPPSKLIEDSIGILNTAFPKYQIRTKLVVDPESIIKRAIEKSQGENEIYFKNKLKTHNTKVIIDKTKPGWEEDFRKQVTEYITEWNQDKDSRMLALVAEIRRVKNSKDHIWGESFNGDNGVVEKLIAPYLQPEWSLVNNMVKELNVLGILLFHNSSTGTLEAISVTNNGLKNIHNLGRGTSILGKFKADIEVQNKNILEATGANIEAMKTLIVLNQLKDVLKGKALAAISILNIDPFEDKGELIMLRPTINTFNSLMSEVSKEKAVPVINNFKSKDLKIADMFIDLYHKIIFNPFLTEGVITSKNRELINILTSYNLGDALPEDNNAKLQWFVNIKSKMLDSHLGLEKNMKGVSEETNIIKEIDQLVSLGIVYYKDLIDFFDTDAPKVGMSMGDLTHGIRSAIFGSAPERDKNGKKIVGILQGSQFSTTDALQSKTMSNLHNLVAIASSKIAETFQKEHNIVQNASEEYYTLEGRSSLQRVAIGSADNYHKVFFETDGDKIRQDFRFKNPWAADSDLNNNQKKYLKTIIFTLYKNSPLNKKGYLTLEALEKSSDFFDIKEGISNIFFTPLVKSTKTSRWVPTWGEFHKGINRFWDSWKDDFDGNAQTEEERVISYKNTNDFKKIHNQYNLSDLSFRESLLDKYTTEHFEINLDTIATKYVLEHIREKYLNSIMLDIHAAITVIKMHGVKTGNVEELISTLEDFWDQIKISVYNTSIIEGEGRDILLLVKKAQKVASLLTIALRPTLMAKELMVGLYKNISYGYYKIYGDESFGEDDLLFGYTSLLTPTSESFMLNSALNQVYRIANSDLNQLATRKKYDRFGVNFLSDNMYWFSTAPDYINRMSLFLAKMKKDGAIQAHSLDSEGNLIYDPTKDERYSYYFANRNRYKIDNKFTFSDKDDNYTRQRSLYLAALKETNSDRTKLGEKPLTEDGEMISQAYVGKEKASIKTFSDTAYGHYDHDTVPLFFNKAAGVLFGQFLKFYPDKVKFYAGKENKNANRGYMGQRYIRNADGTSTMLWRREEFDEDGNPEISEIPESELRPDEIKVPAMGWQGEPMEGILYSLSKTAHDLFNGRIKTTSPQQMRQAKLALNDLLVSIFLLWIGSLMINDKKGWKQKTETEKTLTKLGMKTMNELNIVASLFGSVQATPAVIGILGNTASDLKKFVNGDMAVSKLLKNNIRTLEILPM